MEKNATVDVIRRIYDSNANGEYLEIRPWPDSPADVLELHVPDADSKKSYGEFHVTMNLDFAEALGQALLAAAAELRSGFDR